MSSVLFRQLAELAAETRHQTVHDGKYITEKLTVVIGYGHMADTHPELQPMFEKHLEAFVGLACRFGYPDLCRHSERLLGAIKRNSSQ